MAGTYYYRLFASANANIPPILCMTLARRSSLVRCPLSRMIRKLFNSYSNSFRIDRKICFVLTRTSKEMPARCFVAVVFIQEIRL